MLILLTLWCSAILNHETFSRRQKFLGLKRWTGVETVLKRMEEKASKHLKSRPSTKLTLSAFIFVVTWLSEANSDSGFNISSFDYHEDLHQGLSHRVRPIQYNHQIHQRRCVLLSERRIQRHRCQRETIHRQPQTTVHLTLSTSPIPYRESHPVVLHACGYPPTCQCHGRRSSHFQRDTQTRRHLLEWL